MSTQFNNWLDTFLSEKGIDLDTSITVAKEDSIFGDNHMTVANIVEAMKSADAESQATIKDTIVKIDFLNRDVMDYFQHIASRMAI